MTLSLRSRLLLHAIQARDRARLRALARRHPGLEIHPDATTNLAVAQLTLARGARLRVGAGVATERDPGALRIWVGEDAELEIGDATWLRVETGPLALHVYPGARMRIGRDGFLSGCSLSAKLEVSLGRQVWVGPGSQIYDTEHALDLDTPERRAAVRIGDFCWIATAVTVLRGVEIGAHSVVGARSLVTHSLPDHVLAFGSPAVVKRKIGSREGLRA